MVDSIDTVSVTKACSTVVSLAPPAPPRFVIATKEGLASKTSLGEGNEN